MAIKIIKEGKKKKAVYRAKCSNCGCEFEFNKEDAFFGEDGDRGYRYLTINCPHCEVKIYSWHVNPCRYEVIECNVEEETSTKFEKIPSGPFAQRIYRQQYDESLN